LKKRKSTVVRNDASSPSSKGLPSKPPVKKRKINVAPKMAIAPQSRTRQTKAVATNTTVDLFLGKGLRLAATATLEKL
jgi:hypothetical protein